MRQSGILQLMILVAVLASTPLRLAEAASDQAQTLAEADGSVVLEPIDGGVGDDSGATIRSHSCFDSDLDSVEFRGVASATDRHHRTPAEGLSCPIAPPKRAECVPKRLAILQRFLI